MKMLNLLLVTSLLYGLQLSADIVLVIKSNPNEKEKLQEWIKDNKAHILVSSFKGEEFQS